MSEQKNSFIKRKSLNKVLSVLAVLALLVNLMPSSVHAEGLSNTDTSEVMSNSTEEMVTEASSDEVMQSATEVGSEEATQSATEEATQPGTEVGSEEAVQPGTEFGSEEDTQPGTENESEVVTQPSAENGSEEDSDDCSNSESDSEQEDSNKDTDISEEEPYTNVRALEFEEPDMMVNGVGSSYYVGTVIDNNGNVLLNAGVGYKFYSDEDCSFEINGAFEVVSETSVYIKSLQNYTIWHVGISGIDESVGTGSVTQGVAGTDRYDYKVLLSREAEVDQLIKIITAVSALGGSVATSSTRLQIAQMFDITATSDSTDNVTVTGSNGNFMVTLRNNIVMEGILILDEGSILSIDSIGNFTLMRGIANNSYMINIPSGNATLNLGSGTIQNKSITYHYSDGTSDEGSIGGTIPDPGATRYISYTTVNAVIDSTMHGTLTIDGGAEILPYTGTGYSCLATDVGKGNIINMNYGTVNMWDGVTLQNNIIYGNDNDGGVAIRAFNSTLNIYGGTIRKCINRCTGYFDNIAGSSLGDGGALMLTGSSTSAYIYSIDITNCEADNSSAISLWNSASMYFMDGTIHQNYSFGDYDYPAQAISVYGNSHLYMYGGTISDNHGTNEPADIRISSGSYNDLYLFDGTIGVIGSNTESNTIYIYNGNVNQLVGKLLSESIYGNVIYASGEMTTMVLKHAVNAEGNQLVRVVVREGGTIIKEVSTYGIGTGNNPNEDLSMLLRDGVYTVTVTSCSMIKTYTVNTYGESIIYAANRVITQPIVATLTESNITFQQVGTDNSSDGVMEYGISDSENGSYMWQTTPTFTNQNGTKYFRVRARAVAGSFGESTSQSLKVEFNQLTVDFGANEITIIRGQAHTFMPTINTVNFPISNIKWVLSGCTSPDTKIVKNNTTGSGTVMVAVGEEKESLTLTVELVSANGQSYLPRVIDTITICIEDTPPLPTYTVIIPEVVHLNSGSGSFSISGRTENFTTQTLSVTVSSDNNFRLICSGNSILYNLYTDSARKKRVTSASPNIATIHSNVTLVNTLYYSVGGALYSGHYNDVLTFTVVMNNN